MALIGLAKQILHIKYGFAEPTYQIAKAWALGLLVSNKKIFQVFLHVILTPGLKCEQSW